MALFKEAVERKIEDPKGRLARMIKFTSGEAKELIQHLHPAARFDWI